MLDNIVRDIDSSTGTNIFSHQIIARYEYSAMFSKGLLVNLNVRFPPPRGRKFEEYIPLISAYHLDKQNGFKLLCLFTRKF